MHYHTVLIKFPEETSQEVIDEALRRLRAMAAIPSVRALAAGPNIWPRGRKGGWTHGLTLVFDSVDAMMDEFMDHPVHQDVMRDVFPLYADVMAMDVASEGVRA